MDSNCFRNINYYLRSLSYLLAKNQTKHIIIYVQYACIYENGDEEMYFHICHLLICIYIDTAMYIIIMPFRPAGAAEDAEAQEPQIS